jgi:AAA+ ATPase superfamily predicted ATPase
MKKRTSFIDRQTELNELQQLVNDPIFDFCILYGRRRIGKTFLLKQAISPYRFIYYLGRTENNLTMFYEEVLTHFPELADIKKDYGSILRFLKDKVDYVVLDEFQYFIKENENILSELNAIIEESFYQQEAKMNLCISGSSISIIKAKVLDASKPLFGRATKILELKPVSFFILPEFFPNASMEDLVEIFGFADGIPYYLAMIDAEKGFWAWIQTELHNQNSFLNHEMALIFEIEFTNASQYIKIVKAIAAGHTKLNEIAQECNMAPTTLPTYITNLLDLGFIKKEYPITLQKDETKLSRYYIRDNFLRFWFTFIYPKLSALSLGIYDLNFLKEKYSNYLGLVFEDVAKQYLIKNNNILWKFDTIGKYWGKIQQKIDNDIRSVEMEIDLLAFDSSYREILVVECKWSHKVNPLQIIPDLIEKSQHIHFRTKKHPSPEQFRYIIFAKSFTQKITHYESRTVNCIDLLDFTIKNTKKME